VVNIRMVETGAEYFGQFDNIFFNGPDSIVPINEPWEGFYDSNNDSAETSETLTVDVIQVVPQGVLLSWPARSDRAYSVYFQDQNLSTDPGFLPVPNLSGLTSTTGRISVTDTSAVNTSTRFYRVTVQKF